MSSGVSSSRKKELGVEISGKQSSKDYQGRASVRTEDTSPPQTGERPATRPGRAGSRGPMASVHRAGRRGAPRAECRAPESQEPSAERRAPAPSGAVCLQTGSGSPRCRRSRELGQLALPPGAGEWPCDMRCRVPGSQAPLRASPGGRVGAEQPHCGAAPRPTHRSQRAVSGQLSGCGGYRSRARVHVHVPTLPRSRLPAGHGSSPRVPAVQGVLSSGLGLVPP